MEGHIQAALAVHKARYLALKSSAGIRAGSQARILREAFHHRLDSRAFTNQTPRTHDLICLTVVGSLLTLSFLVLTAIG